MQAYHYCKHSSVTYDLKKLETLNVCMPFFAVYLLWKCCVICFSQFGKVFTLANPLFMVSLFISACLYIDSLTWSKNKAT